MTDGPDDGPDTTLLSRLLAEMPADVRARMSAQPPRFTEPTHVESTEDAHARTELARARRRAQWQANCPRMYRQARIDQLDPEHQHRDALARWLDSNARNLVLFSERAGNGKTHAAYALGHQAVERGAWTRAWTVPDLLAALRPDGPPDAFEVACACDVLILDDLGREHDSGSGWTQEQLQMVLDARGREHKRTVVTTNLDGEAMVERYGWPIVDRLQDDVVPLRFTGESRRRPAPW